MSHDCRKCTDYEFCTEPCVRVHQYIMQDAIGRREHIVPDFDNLVDCYRDYKDVLNEKIDSDRNLKKLTLKKKKILKQHLMRMTYKDIAKNVGVSEKTVQRVFKEFRQ